MSNNKVTPRPVGGTALALAVVALCAPAPTAHAHIDVTLGGTHEQRDPGQKASPCGTAGSERGANVYRYRPGATINISLAETIPHPGYFRISFDDDGDDDFVIPSGTSGEFGDCADDPKCGAGLEDFCSNGTVLLDNLDPHAAGTFGQIVTYTWSVTLPNIECDNCTLQIIQMMNDLNYHPEPYPADDIYYRCIDIELSNDAPEVMDTPVENNGMVCSDMQQGPGDQVGQDAGVQDTDASDTPEPNGGADPGDDGDDGDDDGGCSVASGQAPGLLAPLALALFALACRRRRACC